MDLKEILDLAKEVKDYVEQKGKTLPISQGKMLKDKPLDLFFSPIKYTA
jgi:hypothetical protein